MIFRVETLQQDGTVEVPRTIRRERMIVDFNTVQGTICCDTSARRRPYPLQFRNTAVIVCLQFTEFRLTGIQNSQHWDRGVGRFTDAKRWLRRMNESTVSHHGEHACHDRRRNRRRSSARDRFCFFELIDSSEKNQVERKTSIRFYTMFSINPELGYLSSSIPDEYGSK